MHAQGSITIRRRPKDGNPGADAVRYWLVPSVSRIKKTEDGKFYPSSITCEKRKQTGNSSPVATSEGIIKYQIGYSDNSITAAQNYTKAITIPVNCQWVKFVLYVNNVDVASETVSVIIDGESVYLLDLDNEMQGIPCNSSGVPTITGTLASTNSTVYKGASIDSGWAFSKTDSGCTSSINSSTGKVTVSAISDDKASVTVKATKGSQVLTAVMSLYKVKAGNDGKNGSNGTNGTNGKDGVNPVIYSIEVSASAISKSASGTLSPATITAYKKKTTGSTTSRTSDMTLKYKRVGQDSSETTLTGQGGEIKNISNSCTAIELKIYAADSTILDSERIPIVKDGQNGSDGIDGDDGRGIVSVTEYYMFTAGRKPAAGDSDWKTMADRENSGMITEPTDTYPYMWKKTVTSWTYGNDTVLIELVTIKGSTGPQGLQGCIIRVTEWGTGIEYHNDEALTSGTRFLDIAIVTKGLTSFTAYKCKITHTSSSSLTPTNTSYWEKFNSMAPIYTPMIMAQFAILRIAQANQIQVMKNDGVTVNAAMGGGKYPLWIGSEQPWDANFYVDDEGKAHMNEAEIIGKIIAGVSEGQRVELQPDNKSMKIYDSEGKEVASYEGNTYTSLSGLFSNASGTFTIKNRTVTDSGYAKDESFGKGALSVIGSDNDNANNHIQKIINLANTIHSDTPIEVLISGYLATSYSQPEIASTYAASSGISQTEIMTPQRQKFASASVAIRVDTYSDSALKTMVGSTTVAFYSGYSGGRTLNNVRAKTSKGGYHVLRLVAYLSAYGSGMSASVSWGSHTSNKSDISGTYTSDFYVSRYFANGFCLGQSKTNYIMAYNQGQSGMRFIMENSGYGFDVSNAGIKYKHHNGNWMNMPMMVFRGRATYNSNGSSYYWYTSTSFNSTHPILSRVGEGQIKLTFPDNWISNNINPNNCIINVVGFGQIQGGVNPVKAQILSMDSTSVTVSISDDASENDGSFYIYIQTT